MSDKNLKIRAKRIFNTIAAVYSSLDRFVKKSFEVAINVVVKEINLQGKSVLDVGTGPGAWAALFHEKGAVKVHGVDFAEKMIQKAGKRYSGEITFSIGDAENLKEFGDGSFDIITSSYVLHGVKQDVRKNILIEMKRITKEFVVINDFFGETGVFTRFLEYLEKSDYIHFKENFLNEMKDIFPYVEMFDLGNGSAIYLAKK